MSNKKWIIPLLILVLLITANFFRYEGGYCLVILRCSYRDLMGIEDSTYCCPLITS
jgi:hypothetical protein